MVVFKINGERNSGTTFLTEILKINNFPCSVTKINGRVVYNWKHAVPIKENKELDEKVIDLFIFRNLDSWLISMFKNPYELEESKFNTDFKLFLNIKQSSANYWTNQYNEVLNKDDNGKTIFDIRYYKFNKIMEYAKDNKDVIFINLSFIQNEKNLLRFLNFLSNKYMPELKSNNYILSIKHTKDSSNEKNKKYDINIDEYRDIINRNKNIEIENFINNVSVSDLIGNVIK